MPRFDRARRVDPGVDERVRRSLERLRRLVVSDRLSGDELALVGDSIADLEAARSVIDRHDDVAGRSYHAAS